MVESKVVRINRTYYVRVPSDEAKRLGLHEGQVVDVAVKPARKRGKDIVHLFGKYKGQIPAWDELKRDDYFGHEARARKIGYD